MVGTLVTMPLHGLWLRRLNPAARSLSAAEGVAENPNDALMIEGIEIRVESQDSMRHVRHDLQCSVLGKVIWRAFLTPHHPVANASGALGRSTHQDFALAGLRAPGSASDISPKA
jgi:hypothetical protein